ncbi:ABC transporter substrate-binding protein, partial [Paenibacillus sepulcri]|nr:ABC transporter substrate-binding protein [Paenibacillus sepulcri]
MLRNRTWPGLALVFIMLAVMLTACGGGDGGKGAANSPSPAASPSQTPSASPDTAAVRSYTDALGRTVDIPANPQRIVTTQYLPELLAVGVKPIGAVTHLLTSFASVKDQIAGIEDLGAINEMNLEKTLQLQPDLIIATESSDID